MDLILWRHAEAEEGEPDLQRCLTPKGQKQARRMAEWLGTQLPEGCRIFVSPALRTIQTADAIGRKYKIAPQLAPGAGPLDILRTVNWPNSKETVLVVGHQPTIGQVASLLLTGKARGWEVKKSAVWWFVQREAQDPDSLYLKAVMTPELIVK
ncbi:MAG: phosphohistidine phosphatase [Massilia sp.]|jgi:phosphohistidine phosphatase|nr:phosphohistidine phosphatase [Massilia sp.]MDB5950140.1 phosphohistidine phosphatase [Massilia sp.]